MEFVSKMITFRLPLFFILFHRLCQRLSPSPSVSLNVFLFLCFPAAISRRKGSEAKRQKNALSEN